VGLEIFFICHKLSFILCGAMTTNEIMGFSNVLIALPQNHCVIIKFFKGWIEIREWNSLWQKVYSYCQNCRYLPQKKKLLWVTINFSLWNSKKYIVFQDFLLWLSSERVALCPSLFFVAFFFFSLKGYWGWT